MEVKIVTGVPIYTMNDDTQVVEAVAIVNGVIDYVGAFNDARSRYSMGEIIKLKKGIVIPGFIDSSIKIYDFSMMFKDADLTGISEKDEVLDIIAKISEKKKETDWIIAGGLSRELDGRITREDIDSVAKYHPVVLYFDDFNSAVVNTKVLEISGIDENRRDPDRGRIERDGRGSITGVLRGRAVELLIKEAGTPDSRVVTKALRRGIDRLISLGITTIGEATFDLPPSVMKILMSLWGSGELKIRIGKMFGPTELEFIKKVGMVSGYGDDFFRLGGVGLILDGGLSTLSGYMKRPYLTSGGNGVLLYSEDEIYRILRDSYSSHIWALLAAVGDMANRIAIDQFERIARDRSLPRLKRRIDGAEVLSDDDVKRFSDFDIIAVLNPGFIPRDRNIAIKSLGETAGNMFRFNSLKKNGVQIAFASNTPEVSPDPFYNIYCAVERKAFDEGPEMRFYPREKIEIQDAILAYTAGGSVACGMDDIVGKIEVGRRADLVQLSHDIFKIENEDLKNVKVLKTMVDGELVFIEK